jgi:hypothetical protein
MFPEGPRVWQKFFDLDSVKIQENPVFALPKQSGCYRMSASAVRRLPDGLRRQKKASFASKTNYFV